MLEDRCLLTLFTVTSSADSGANTLRADLAAAGNGDTIDFNVTSPITLTSGTLTVATNVTIQGPGAAQLTIQGNNTFGIFTVNADVTATISGLTISGGKAGNVANGRFLNGGGIFNQGTLTVQNSTLSGNSANVGGIGGGIYNTGTLTLQNSTLSGNSASGGIGVGGGISNTGTLTVLNSTLAGNTASIDSGGIENRGTLTLQNSTLSGNTAGVGGGGGILNSGTLTVQNSTLSGNSASGRGGGIYNFTGGTLTVLNSTLSGNSSASFGGGITNSIGTLNLGNTIVAGNLAPSAPDIEGIVTSQGHNLIGNTSGASGLVASDLQNVASGLDPAGLKNNGGPTQTIALLPGSLAIDAGSNALATAAGLTTDQRGFNRFVDGTVDIGAFEFGASASFFAVGADAGGGPQVNVYNAMTGAIVASFYAFSQSFTGGVRVAVDEINGSDDIICAAGPGGGPQIAIYNGNMLASGSSASAALVTSFDAFAPSFTGGVFVAAGTSSSGQNWIAASAGSGGGPQVVVWTVNAILAGAAAGTAPTPLTSFYASAPSFTGGVTVALGDVLGTGNLDVICGAGPGGGPQVIVVDGTKFSQIASSGITSALLASFEAFAPNFTGGVFVSGGATAGGQFNLIIGAGAGGGPQVLVVQGTLAGQVASNGQIASSALLDSFYALSSSFSGGVRVGFSAAFGSSGTPVILTGAGPGGGPQVAPFSGATFAALTNFFALPQGFTGGLFIAG